MDPVTALREIGFWLERDRADTYRVKAYRRAADVVDSLSQEERDRRQGESSWGDVPGIGPKTATVIREAMAGATPPFLAGLRDQAGPLTEGGTELRALLQGDLHCHSDWSDGGSPPDEMFDTATTLGHAYLLLTDHSPRLTVARGLSADRLTEQKAVVAELDAEREIRCLHGIEVDILEDGGLDQEADLLAGLDCVVASVHSKLRSDSETMTERMVRAIANPRVNVLGHCTGRLITGGRGTRPESVFDAEVVFEACRQFNTAVEINSRPERLDPPMRLLTLAVEMGCLFSIDTDAHAPGQLDWQVYGCERAERAGIEPERIINTWPVDKLLSWCALAG